MLRFTVSEVLISAIAWFINASGPAQWNKHMESSLSSPLPVSFSELAYTFALLELLLEVLWIEVCAEPFLGSGGNAAFVLVSGGLVISPFALQNVALP